MFTLLLCGLRQAEYDASFYEPGLDADILNFVSAAVFFAIPIGVFMFLWKNFVTDSRTQYTTEVEVSFDDRPPLNSHPEEAGYPSLVVFLYLLTGLLAFSLGVLAYEAVHGFG